MNPLICFGKIGMVRGERKRWNTLSEEKRLYLRVGDKVTHRSYQQWGIGMVVEVMTSIVAGGTCLVRIRFQDGRLRTFNNDLDSEGCCSRFGIRQYWDPVPEPRMARSKLLVFKEDR